MGKEVRNLAKVPYWQCTCPSPSAHLLGHGSKSIPQLRAQNYNTIRLLRLRVKFDGIWRRTPELEHLPWTGFIRCIWNTLFPIKAPFAKQMFLFWSLHFCLLSSTKSVPMYLSTCWKYKQSHIFISPCRNDPSQLQNCKTKRFFTVFGTLLESWRQLEEIPSPTHPHTPKQRMFCLCFASSNVSFGLVCKALHCFNGCANKWSAPGRSNTCSWKRNK